MTAWPKSRSAGLGRTRLCHPWGREPERGGRAPMFPCRTVSDPSGIRLDGFSWISLGPIRARQGPIWSHKGPYISRTLIRDSRVIRRGSSGPVGPRQRSDGFPSEHCFGTTGPDGARRIARLVRIGARLMYGPPGHATASPWALQGPSGPTAARGAAGGSVCLIFIGSHRFGQLLLASAKATCWTS